MLTLRTLKHSIAAAMTGLAIQPVARAAMPEPVARESASDPFSLEELGVTVHASHHPELQARYAGPRTSAAAQVMALEGKRASRFYNRTFDSGREAREFIRARTR